MYEKVKYFYSPFFVTIIGFFITVIVEPEQKLYSLYSITILAFLEIALSFDNAVVNARILTNMTRKWQRIFILFGLPIAIFGIRLVIPIILLNAITNLSLMDIFKHILEAPLSLKKEVENSLPIIYMFGGGFLIMVCLKFFIADGQTICWIKSIERNKFVDFIKRYPRGHVTLGLAIGFITIYGVGHVPTKGVVLAFLLGVILHELIDVIYNIFDIYITRMIVRNGLMGFLYLETLDAIFSIDSIISAFAISTNIFNIMIGLGVGAAYMRSMTIFFVESKTLKKFRYLEHGAHYTVGFLAFDMFVRIHIHIPEWFTGLISTGFIIASFIHSYIFNKKNTCNQR